MFRRRPLRLVGWFLCAGTVTAFIGCRTPSPKNIQGFPVGTTRIVGGVTVEYRAATEEDRAAEKKAVEEMEEVVKGVRFAPLRSDGQP